jgi:hypothetical protein
MITPTRPAGDDGNGSEREERLRENLYPLCRLNALLLDGRNNDSSVSSGDRGVELRPELWEQSGGIASLHLDCREGAEVVRPELLRLVERDIGLGRPAVRGPVVEVLECHLAPHLFPIYPGRVPTGAAGLPSYAGNRRHQVLVMRLPGDVDHVGDREIGGSKDLRVSPSVDGVVDRDGVPDSRSKPLRRVVRDDDLIVLDLPVYLHCRGVLDERSEITVHDRVQPGHDRIRDGGPAKGQIVHEVRCQRRDRFNARKCGRDLLDASEVFRIEEHVLAFHPNVAECVHVDCDVSVANRVIERSPQPLHGLVRQF